MKPITINIIVPLYKSYHLIDNFIDKINLEKIINYRVIFVDNTDGITHEERDTIFLEIFKKYYCDYRYNAITFKDDDGKEKRCMYSESVNNVVNNYEYFDEDDYRFLIINPDHYPIEKNWLTKMVCIWDDIGDENICTLGTLQYHSEDKNSIWHYGCNFKPIEQRCHPLDWMHINYYDGNDFIKCDGNTGSGIMIDLKKFKELNMYDVVKYPHYSSDADFCLRASELGYTHYCSNVETVHLVGRSSL